MKTKDKIENWEEEFDKLLRDWHYENIREKGIDELKSFIHQLLSSQKSRLLKDKIKEIEEMQRDILSQFCYQGAPTKAEVQREKLKSEGYEICKGEALSILKK